MHIPLDYETLRVIWWGLMGVLLIVMTIFAPRGLVGLATDAFRRLTAARPGAVGRRHAEREGHAE